MRGHGPFVRLTLLAAAAVLALAAAEGPAPAATGVPAASLSVSVTSSPDPVLAVFEAATDHVVVKNNGSATATGVTVADVVAAPLSVQPPSVTPPPVDLAPGASLTRDFRVWSLRSGTYERTVRAEATGLAPASARAVSTFRCALCIATSTSPARPVAFEPLTYTVTASNPLGAPIGTVEVVDTLPPDFLPGAAPPGCTLAGHTATCELGDLDPGASRSVSFPGTPQAVGRLTNVAEATGFIAGDPGFDIPDGSTTTVVVEPPSADLALKQDVKPPTAGIEEAFRFTAVVRNNGPGTAASPVVTETFPPELRFGGLPSECTGGGSGSALATNTVTCELSTLPSGGQDSVSFEVFPRATGTFSFEGEVKSAAVVDPVAANDVVVTDANVDCSGRRSDVLLCVVKGDAPDPVAVGQPLTYTLTVDSIFSSGREVFLLDTLPDGTDFVSSSLSTCALAGRDLTCQLGPLARGSTRTVTVVVRPTAPGTLVNTAVARTPGSSSSTSFFWITSPPAVARTRVVPAADVSVVKTGPATADVGDTVAYTLAVRNAGPAAAAGVSVSDALPPSLQLVSATPSQGSCSGTTLVTCSLGAFSAGSAATVVVRARATAAGTAVDVASVASATDPDSGGAVDPDRSNNVSRAATTVRQRPSADVSITKTATPDPANVGDTIAYLLTVRNGGPGAAAGVVVTDPLPAAVRFISSSPTQGTCSGSSTVTCNLGTLAAGASASVVVRVRALEAGAIVNAASVTSSQDPRAGGAVDPDLSNNSASTHTTATSADLSVAIAGSPDPVGVGHELTYAVVVKNAGPSVANDVALADTLPAGAELVSATTAHGACTSLGVLTCRLGELAAGDQAPVTIVVRPATAGSVSNAVSVTSLTHDPLAANDSAAAVTRALSADLALAMRATPQPADVGAPLIYTLDVANAGPTEARGVRLRDPLPRDVELLSVTPSRGTCTAAPTVDCSLGTLAQTETARVRIVVVPRHGGAVVNTATVAGTDLDPREANNRAAVRLDAASADVAVALRADGDRVSLGSPVGYTLSVRNVGPSPAHAVQVVDDLPAGAELVSVRTDSGTCRAEARLVCDLGELPDGGAATVRLTVRPRARGALTNAANVAADEFDPDLGNNRASLTTGGRPLPRLLLAPGLGTPGTVASVTGLDFPPGALVTLRWQPGTGAATVRADAAGSFRLHMLVFPHDTLGGRLLVATAERTGGTATAPFLVVPGRLEPQDFVERG